MNRLNRVIAAMLAAVMLTGIVPGTAEAQTAGIRKTLDIYYFNSKRLEGIEAVFFSEEADIPYISLRTAAEVIRRAAQLTGDTELTIEEGYTTYAALEEADMLWVNESIDADTDVYLFERENGSFAVFDAVHNCICISDWDLFRGNSYALSGGDILTAKGSYSADKAHDAKTDLFYRVDNRQFVRTGDITTICLDDYGISLEQMDDMIYLPVATFSDLILRVRMVFNGESLFVIGGTLNDYTENADGETLYELYYKPGARDRSAQLIDFNYKELCLMLDQWYGLAEAHGIKNGFDDYFVASEQAGRLCSDDINVYTEAMYELLYGYFGDFHSTLSQVSPYAGGAAEYEQRNRSISMYESDDRDMRFYAAREAAGITVNNRIAEGYSEIGDTAFITFDSFDVATVNYYDQRIQKNLGNIYRNDTVGLVIWAHKQIHRENSPIRRVVIDLSCNGGGSLDACVYVAAWVLGQATVNIENVRTGARYSTGYWVDTDLDGEFLDDDDLGIDALDVYCLISGNSFSCGNYLPTMLKQDGRVTLVGQTSGGGGCIVHNAATADGTLFNISDFRRLSVVKNGSFYNVDQGVEPDIPLRRCDSYYDREGLMAYLDTFR